ncbi:MAG: hypothetical protein LBK12_08030 [Odoribacteraceae bacterium]|jgi:hypothetical protein|nr:hypothetical protein [Odoribacteraceae bacterium]
MEDNTAPDIQTLAPLLDAYLEKHPEASPEDFAAWIIVPSVERSVFLAALTHALPIIYNNMIITSLEIL